MESGWLVERGSGPAYIAVGDFGRVICWTFAHLEALRFARMEDAEIFSLYLKHTGLVHGDIRVVEHVWITSEEMEAARNETKEGPQAP